MQHSEQLNELATALAKAQSEIRAAPKSSVNPHFKSKYADLDECWNAAREPLTKNGLSVIQNATTTESGVVLTTMILHSSGQWLRFDGMAAAPKDFSPQGIGAAVTYLRRYGFSAAVGITSDEDLDGEDSRESQKQSPAARMAAENRRNRIVKMVRAFAEINVSSAEIAAHIKRDSLDDMTAGDFTKVEQLYSQLTADRKG
jgi:hypothetical protein